MDNNNTFQIPEYYHNFRKEFTPEKVNIICLLESPPISGNYFYRTDGNINESLFSALMKFLEIPAQTKEQGLTEFCNRGYILVDATYTPVNNIKNPVIRNTAILDNYDNLKKDLECLKADRNQTPIILIKANIYDLFIERLPNDNFNAVNGPVKIPFPSTGQQGNFRNRIKELKEIGVINKILANSVLREHYIPYNIPKSYFKDLSNIKAIVLGADPSNFSSNGETNIIKTVFDLPDGNVFYFRSILDNLNLIGLNLENIYVQNIVRNYMDCETAKNRYWFEFAECWKPLLLEELDKLDPERKLPIFATAEIVLHSLLNDRKKQKIPARDYFEKLIYHEPEENFLKRKLIPCFRRHYPYINYPEYINYIKYILN